jgi:hypothetical protein
MRERGSGGTWAGINLTGRVIGRLIVTTLDEARCKPGYVYWICQCTCGTIKSIRSSGLTSGKVKSCGCLKRDAVIARNKEMITHGLSGTRAYTVWRHMIERCFDSEAKQYSDYGGRGIRVCDRWLNVNNFVADMGQPPPRMTLERIKNSEDYSPENCKWATRREQNNNTRKNVYITFENTTLTRSQWEQRLGLGATTIRSRMRRGMTIEQALRPENLVRSGLRRKLSPVC